MSYIRIPLNNNKIGSRFSTKKLPIPLYYQKNTMWCWAACCQMILDYYGRRSHQCQITGEVKGASFCCDFPDACNVPGGNFEISGLLTNSTAYEWKVTYSLTSIQVCNLINKEFPFVLCKINPEHDINHAIVVVGYEYDRYTDELFLLCNDPWHGSYKESYSNIVGMWQYSIYPNKIIITNQNPY